VVAVVVAVGLASVSWWRMKAREERVVSKRKGEREREREIVGGA